MQRHPLALGLLTAALAAGCGAPGFSPTAGTVTVVGPVQAGAARHLMGMPAAKPFTLDRVTRLEAWGRDLTIDQTIDVKLGELAPTAEVELTSLQPRHHYRVTLRAYIDEDVVSADAGSITLFDTLSDAATGAANEQVRVPGFKLELRDQDWVGSATGGVVAVSTLTDKLAAPSFVLPSPVATTTPSPTPTPPGPCWDPVLLINCEP